MCELYKELARCLSCDPAPAHPAALQRYPGSTNYKYGEPIRVGTVRGTLAPVDITDLEALRDLLPEDGIIPRKAKTNGHAQDGMGPVDVDAKLADMQDGNIHDTQLSCIAALLNSGMTVEAAVEDVLGSTKERVGGDDWKWGAEKKKLEGMAFDWVIKHPELSPALPDKFRDKFDAAIAAGKRPKFVWHREAGWQIRGYNGSEPPPLPPLKAYLWRPPHTLPVMDSLYGDHYQRGVVGVTFAPGGTGKSSLNLVEIISLATGRTLAHHTPHERVRVWLHNGDDNDKIFECRIGAVLLHYDIPKEEIEGWLYYTTPQTFPLKVADGYQNLRINAPIVKRIEESITQFDIGAAVFDPLVTVHAVSEQDNVQMDAVVRTFAGIADKLECSIELVHHTRKRGAGLDGDFSMDDARGASAIRDAVRSARVLNVMSPTDAAKAGMRDDERGYHFRVDSAKKNYAPPGKAEWYRHVSVDLGNGGRAWAWSRHGSSPALAWLQLERPLPIRPC